jgi:hypothetical protein
MSLDSQIGPDDLDQHIIPTDREVSVIRDTLDYMWDSQSDHEWSNFKQSYRDFRGTVCSWMLDVCQYFSLSLSTSHASILYLDRLEPNDTFTRNEWQMVAICCVLVASKFYEREEVVPDLARLEFITRQPISNEDTLNYELWILRRLKWELNAFSPISFASSYMHLGILYEGDQVRGRALPTVPSALKEGSQRLGQFTSSLPARETRAALVPLVEELCSMVLLDPSFKSIPASTLASAAVYTARKFRHVTPAWRPELTSLCRCDMEDTENSSVVARMWEAAVASVQADSACGPAVRVAFAHAQRSGPGESESGGIAWPQASIMGTAEKKKILEGGVEMYLGDSESESLGRSVSEVEMCVIRGDPNFEIVFPMEGGGGGGEGDSSMSMADRGSADAAEVSVDFDVDLSFLEMLADSGSPVKGLERECPVEVKAEAEAEAEAGAVQVQVRVQSGSGAEHNNQYSAVRKGDPMDTVSKGMALRCNPSPNSTVDIIDLDGILAGER